MSNFKKWRKFSRIVKEAMVIFLAVAVGMAVDAVLETFCRFDIHLGGVVSCVIIWVYILIVYS